MFDRAGMASGYGKLVFIGDSLTQRGMLRVPRYPDKYKPWRYSSSVGAPFNNGWIVSCYPEGTATAGGTLSTDGAGRLQWSYNGDSYGTAVGVSLGGAFILSSGTSSVRCFVRVNGAQAYPAASTATVTMSGYSYILDYNLESFMAWTVGQVGGRFSEVENWGIDSSTSASLLNRLSQVFQGNIDACVLLIGVNDAPANGAAAAASLANIKTSISTILPHVNKLYVGDLFPETSHSTTARAYEAAVSEGVREYCSGLPNVRFWSSVPYMVDPTAVGVTPKTGVLNTDNIHLNPFGAYQGARALVSMIQADYPQARSAPCNQVGVWDATLGKGTWNTNPTLRGTAGTVTPAVGITGTAPDGWTVTRGGTTQLCTTSFDAAADGGLSWFSMSVSGATDFDYHSLQQTVNVPAGVNVGDYYVIEAEMCIFALTGTGLMLLSVYANSNGNIQNNYLFQNNPAKPVATFNTENPVLALKSTPQQLAAGVTSFNLFAIAGAKSGGGAGKVGFRSLRMYKVPAPTV